jgi:GH15 family glucan-1,4-alpha-glucosidase
MFDLFQHSIDVILKNQAPSGAYIASPNFPTYAYSWLRDGTFIAHAMDRVGQHASSARFHRWVGGVVQRYGPKLDELLARQASGAPIDPATQMHTRFTLDGQEASDEWTNFQLDGYGTWLWGLVDHLQRTGDRALYAELRPQAALVARYLAAFWPSPCYDCWEEFGDKVHISTLAAIFGGLRALADYDPAAAPVEAAPAIRAFVLEHGLCDGHLVKFIGSPLVDSSLLGAATPYGLLAPNDPHMLATVALIEAELLHGGVRRYRDDVYYGGGEWVLLAAWLGWYYVESGAFERARALRDWVAAQADASGDLPEQVSVALLAPEHYQPWVERWGPIAKPLLWSHAMYLVLENALAGDKMTR